LALSIEIQEHTQELESIENKMKELEMRINTMTDEKHSLFNSLRQLLAEDPAEKKKEDERSIINNNTSVIPPTTTPSPSISPAPSQTPPPSQHNPPRNDSRKYVPRGCVVIIMM